MFVKLFRVLTINCLSGFSKYSKRIMGVSSGGRLRLSDRHANSQKIYEVNISILIVVFSK
jgi:hypothetical protein